MESSSFALLAVFSLLLVGNAIAARKDPGVYRKDDAGADCHTGTEASKEQAEQLLKDFEHKVEKAFTEDFEPGPNISVYHDNGKLGEEKSFVKDFEPGPNISIYHDDEVDASKEDKSFVKDFEPGPNISVYHDDEVDASKEDNSFVKDFEPGPNISVYK